MSSKSDKSQSSASGQLPPPDLEEQIGGLQRVVEQDPDDIEAWRKLAAAYVQMNHVQGAVRALKAAAERRVYQGLFQDALELYREALRLDPEHVELLVELGKTHHQLGRFDEAFEAFYRAGEIYRQQGDREAAAELFRRVLRLETEDIELKLALAQSFVAMELIGEAVEAFRLCANHFDTLGMLDRFVEVADKLLEKDPSLDEVRQKVVEALLREAEIYMGYRLYDKAEEAVHGAMARCADDVDAHEMMLALYKARGDRRGQLAQLLELARMTRTDVTRSSEYLRRALTLSENPDQIYAYGESLGIDLLRPSAGELGDEVTNTCFTDEAPEEGGEDDKKEPTLRAKLFAKLKPSAVQRPPGKKEGLATVLTLLRIVEHCKRPTRIAVYAGPDEGLVAEFIAQEGNLGFGAIINGCLFVDGARDSGTTALWRHLDEAPAEAAAGWLDAAGLSAEHPWLVKLGELAQSVINRRGLLETTAMGLLAIAEACDGRRLKVRRTEVSGALPASLCMSPFRALLICARRTAEVASDDEAVRFFERAHERAEEAWIFDPAPAGTGFPLPVEMLGARELSVGGVEEMGRVLSQAIGFSRRVAGPGGPEGPQICQLIAEDGAWCCVTTAHRIALLRAPHKYIGQTIALALQAVEEVEA